MCRPPGGWGLEVSEQKSHWDASHVAREGKIGYFPVERPVF